MKRLLSVFLAMALFTPVVNSAFAGRHYDARIARFTTPDPVLNKSPKELLEEGQSAALSTSPYNYGLNNPVALVDPDGNFPVFFVAVAAAYLMTQYSGDHPGGSPSLATDAAVFGAAAGPYAVTAVYRAALAHPAATATAITMGAEAIAPPGASVVPGGLGSNARGLVGKEFESFLSKAFGNSGPFSVAKREFDGAIGGNIWYEAKSGGVLELLTKDSKAMDRFKSVIGEQSAIATKNNKRFMLISNSRIPQDIKEWLTKKGIQFTEILEQE